MLSVDLRKACNTIRWDAILKTLRIMGFLNISSLSLGIVFNLLFNACRRFPHQSFQELEKAERLRQGYLVSPILFNLVMDSLSRFIQKGVDEGRVEW